MGGCEVEDTSRGHGRKIGFVSIGVWVKGDREVRGDLRFLYLNLQEDFLKMTFRMEEKQILLPRE